MSRRKSLVQIIAQLREDIKAIDKKLFSIHNQIVDLEENKAGKVITLGDLEVLATLEELDEIDVKE